MKTKDLVLCSIFAAITSILSQISIPIPFTTVPLTMQIFSVALTGMVLGSKRGFISIMIYLILGAIGIPVFAQMSGGIAVLVGPTGGFLLGCPFMAFIVGLVCEKSSSKIHIMLSMIVGLIVIYIIGTIMFSLITKSSLYQSLLACVLPFVLVDIIKLILAVSVGTTIVKRVKIGVKSC